MFTKICTIIETLILYLFGYRAYHTYAQWKSFNNEVILFNTVLLNKNIDLHSGEAYTSALDQMGAFNDLFKSFYVFDHFEPTSIFSYLGDVIFER